MENKKQLKRSTNKMIAGVCGGVAEYFGIDPTIVRILFAVFGIAYGVGLLVYIVALFVMPRPEEEEKAGE